MPASARLRTVLTAATLAITMAVTGCASAGQETTPATEGGTLRYGISGANLGNGHMDPHKSQLDVSAYVMRNVLDSLVYQAADGSFSDWLAKDWKISDDGLDYTFTLRDDVLFHDGTEFNAAAVKANFDHVVAEETASAQAASMLGGAAYDSTEVISDHEVVVHLKQPYAPLLGNLSTAFLGFWSPAVLEKNAAELVNGGPDISVGTGPFVLSKAVPNQQLTFTANEKYAWAPEAAKHQGPPMLKSLDMVILPEGAQRVGAFNSGQLDAVGNLTPNLREQLDSSATVNAAASPGVPFSLYLNQTNGYFADATVRHAFMTGLDIDSAVQKVFFGQYERAWSVLSPTTPNAYDPSTKGQWSYNPEVAGDLLDEAGWTERDAEGYRTKDGKRLTLRWIAYTPVSEEHLSLGDLFIADAKKLGIDLVRDILEPGEYNENYGSGTFDLTDWGFAYPDGDALRNHLHSEGFQNASHVNDPKVDALLAEAVATTDPAERAKLYAELQQWAIQNAVIVPIYLPQFITATSAAVQGVEYDIFGWPLFAGASVSATG